MQIINQGNTDDIKCHLKHFESKFSTEVLEAEIAAEKSDRNRVTVIKLLQGAIKRKQKTAV